jgi:short-subunit dehydrogenase
MEDYQEIATQLKNIDIAMLFLNAGVGQLGAFEDLTLTEVETIFSVNAMQPVYLCKVLLGQMLARSQKSAIVITSSGLGNRPFPGAATYSAAKSCVSYLGEALTYELQDRIDVLPW